MSDNNETQYLTVSRKLLDSAAVFIYVVDRETDEILMVNDYYASRLGVPISRMEGHKCWEFVNPDEGRCAFCPRDFDANECEMSNLNLMSVEAFNPTIGIWSKYTTQPVEWIDGRPADIITMLDISDEKLLREELKHLAYYDKSLGIPNRAKLEKDLSGRPNGNYCLIAFDYISLRNINDAYGRKAGDALLKSVISWINSFNLQHFEIYRLGGDEFCLLMDFADMMSTSGLADRIFERFHDPWEISLENEDTFMSSKIAMCVIDGRSGFDNVETILSIIERTLGIAKQVGHVAVYDQAMDQILKHDLELEISLKTCVTNGMQGFEVFFQPIVEAQDGKWKGLEALCRWESPEFGRIPPLIFIDIAEHIGLINTVGHWVLSEAIRICASLNLHELEDFFLDVNLSPAQMSDETLVSKVLIALQQYGFPGSNLALEITESEQISKVDYTRTTIERLRALDIKMALDDFGTGYSNFNNLKNLPVSILKTEKEFVDDIAYDSYQQFLSRFLVQLAHKADMKLIAEGVETVDQVKELIKNSVDYLQGYLFAKPLSFESLAENVEKFMEVNPLFDEVRKEIEREENEKSI